MKSDAELRRDPPDALAGTRRSEVHPVEVSIHGRVVAEWRIAYRIEAAAAPVCTDAELAEAVDRALAWDLWVPDERLTVTVAEGRVTLDGEIDSRFQRDAAVRAVSRLPGVRGITDRMTIRPTPTVAEVKARIARTLGTDAVPGTIRVETFPGAVMLRGTVPSRTERDGAERAAWSAPGVVEVWNGLEVNAPRPGTNEAAAPS